MSTYLGILLRAGLRAGNEGEPAVVILESPLDIEREGPAPAFFLFLYRIVADRRAPRPLSILEAGDEPTGGLRLELRHPPLWVACRYLLGVRGRDPEEEAELTAAALRTLHDHPSVSSEHLPSIRNFGYADRYPLEIVDEREGWRLAGLSSPRLTIAFQVTAPIPSALSAPLERVLDREIGLGELP